MKLTYLQRLHDAKCVWLADCETLGKVVVKFVKQYSRESHQLLTAADLAPKLYYVDDPDQTYLVGWRMVVMEFIPNTLLIKALNREERASVLAGVQQAGQILHAHGLAFGDLRLANILISRRSASDIRIALIDFDWSGKEGEARYPCGLNMEHRWLDGAQPGELVQKDHDLQWIERLQDLLPGSTYDVAPLGFDVNT